MSISDTLLAFKNKLPTHVTLVAVTKTKSKSVIEEAYQAGQRDFGENYVQELVEKAEQLPKDIHWHFIGHLQSNKVKYIASFVHLIHGVDSFSLLKEINKQAKKNNRTIKCLLQIYIAQEESKFGFDVAEVTQLLNSDELKSFENIEIIGVMGMASNTEDQSQIRAEFKSLKQIADQFNLSVISMGMSGDFAMAIEEGSTMVRVGSLLFGSRS